VTDEPRRETIGVLQVSHSLGLGGTERNIQNICKHMRFGLFRHHVVGFFGGGERERAIEEHADVRVCRGSVDNLARYVRERRINVAIVHRAGNGGRHWSRILRACREAGVKAILEYNVFGLVDESEEDDLIDWHLHVSKTSWLKFLERAERTRYRRIPRHRVMYNLCDGERFREMRLPAAERARFRMTLGLKEDDLILLRVGRPDVRKWSDFILDAIPMILEKVPKARFLFMTAPESRARYLQRRFPGSAVILPKNSDDRALAAAYSIADVLLPVSRRGESFGYTIAEAFSLGVPAVVNSTPGRDNAQIELVDHMVSGIVANTPQDFAEAVEYLHRHPDERERMGVAGRVKAKMYEADAVARSLAGLIIAAVRGKGGRGEMTGDASERTQEFRVYPSLEELEAWGAEYSVRLGRAWSDRSAQGGGTAVVRAYWFVRDLVDVCRQKAGDWGVFFQADAKRG
jgi:glycosyltransferase involved in cell wall biosynthesis